MEPLNICMVSVHSSPVGELGTRDTGGMSVYLRETAMSLGVKGHHVDLVTLAGCSNRVEEKEIADNVRLICLPCSSVKGVDKNDLIDHLPEMANVLGRFIEPHERTYSVIHSHYWLSGLVIDRVLTNSDFCPHCVTFHTLGEVKNRATKISHEPRKRLTGEAELVSCCDRIICFTDSEKEDLLRLYGAENNKIAIIPCGVNSSQFDYTKPTSKMKEFLMGYDAPRLLYLGRFVEIKGIDVLLEAISYLKDRRFTLFLSGGDGAASPERKRIVELAKGYGVEEKVHFPGRIAHHDLPLWYSAVDGVLVPSLHESFSLVALEALSCGTAVVGSNVGCMKEVLQNGTGMAVPPGDASALKEAIQHVFLDNHFNSIPRSQRSFLAGRYSWKKTAAMMEHEYDQLRNRREELRGQKDGLSGNSCPPR